MQANKDKLIDRYLGCLLGLATGDALGTTLEFKRQGSFRPITDMIGGGPFGLDPGQWTDDTSMALCLGMSILKKQGFDTADQMQRYQRWKNDGYLSSTGHCFDIGNTVGAALSRFEQSGNPVSGSTDPSTAGNGSLMRLAPIPMAYFFQPLQAINYAGEMSKTTHGATEAVDACRFYTGLIIGALNGIPKGQLLTPLFHPSTKSWQSGSLIEKINEVAGGSYLDKSPPEIRGTGYVVQSLEASLWAFANTDNFKDGALAAVNLGDDADTTGAIYGQLAGAHYGYSSIPESWRNKLHDQLFIETLSDNLLNYALQNQASKEVITSQRTSESHPLQIDSLDLPGGGRIGMTFCPGKQQPNSATGSWNRDLNIDLHVIREWGAEMIVTLVEQHELESLLVADFGERTRAMGMEWLHLPIRDVSIPSACFEKDWLTNGLEMKNRLQRGESLVLHCKGGLGRTGLVAGRLMIEFGFKPKDAIAMIRRQRPGTIETQEQERYVLDCRQSFINIKQILVTLNTKKIRATYGAVGELLGIPAIGVGQILGDKRCEASWVVSTKTGRPSGYSAVDCHEMLYSNPRVIRRGKELRSLVDNYQSEASLSASMQKRKIDTFGQAKKTPKEEAAAEVKINSVKPAVGESLLMGVDLAWKSDVNGSGLAVGTLADRQLQLEQLVTNVIGFNHVVDRIKAQPGLQGLAIDAPLIINNSTGRRLCEKALSEVYSPKWAGCHPSNLALYPDAASVQLSNLLSKKGFTHLGEPATSKWQIECYPHPAIIELFGLNKRLAYKKGTTEEKKLGQVNLARFIRSLADSAELALTISSELDPFFDEARISQLTGQAIKDNEDGLDAVMCLYIAGLYAIGSSMQYFGSVDNGYIVVPCKISE